MHPAIFRVPDMAKTSLYAAIIFCLCTDPCFAYRLVGSESLSDALVAHHYTINDRLDAVIVVDPTIPTFEYQTFYAMGHADEPEGEQGKLHFLEHIIAGTGSGSPEELKQLIARNGGQSHAATGLHVTYFTLRFPSDKMSLAIDIDRERYFGTRIDWEWTYKEKQIVLTEHSRNIANWGNRFSNHFWGLVYGRDNFEGVGTEALIDGIESGDLKQLFHNVLRLKRRLVVVIGDVYMDDVLTRLTEAYPDRGTREESLPAEPRFPNPNALGERYNVKYDSLIRSNFSKAWHIPGLDHPDHAGFHILASILERPSKSLRSSLLDSQLVNRFSVWTGGYRGFGLIACDAVMPANRPIETVGSAVREKLEEIKTHGITEDDLAAARNTRLRHLFSEFFDRSEMAYGFGEAFVLAGDPLHYPRMIRQIRRVDIGDISRIANEHLNDEKSITLSWTLKEERWWHKRRFQDFLVVVVPATVLLLTVLIVGKLIQKFTGKTRGDDDTREYHY